MYQTRFRPDLLQTGHTVVTVSDQLSHKGYGVRLAASHNPKCRTSSYTTVTVSDKGRTYVWPLFKSFLLLSFSSLWGVYSEIVIHHYNIPLAHSFTHVFEVQRCCQHTVISRILQAHIHPFTLSLTALFFSVTLLTFLFSFTLSNSNIRVNTVQIHVHVITLFLPALFGSVNLFL